MAGFVFIAQIAYQGARAGRKTHMTDMDTDGRKAVYTALSNTLIGVCWLSGDCLAFWPTLWELKGCLLCWPL